MEIKAKVSTSKSRGNHHTVTLQEPWTMGTVDKPLVLVTGCDPVVLEIANRPKNGTVEWSIDPTPRPFPLDRRQGDTTSLATADLGGRFTITATCDGTKAFFYLTFVTVRLLTGSVKTELSGTGALQINCQNAKIAAFAEWSFEAKTEFLGDTKGPPIDPHGIDVGVIQNLIDTRNHFFRAKYLGGGQPRGQGNLAPRDL